MTDRHRYISIITKLLLITRRAMMKEQSETTNKKE